MSNKEWYKESFDQVHIPEAVLGKVRNMEKKQKTIKLRSKLRYAVTVIAVLVLCFAVSNGITYAATGESVATWIEKGWSVCDNEAVDIYKIGDEYFAVSEGVDPKDLMVNLKMDKFMSAGHDDFVIIFSKDDDNMGRLVRDNKSARFYLFYGDFNLDITDDLSDGESSGTFELNGKQYEYVVTGNWTDNWESVVNGNWEDWKAGEDFHIQITEK